MALNSSSHTLEYVEKSVQSLTFLTAILSNCLGILSDSKVPLNYNNCVPGLAHMIKNRFPEKNPGFDIPCET